MNAARPARRRACQYGLSLLELLVAFAILAFSLGVLYRADASNLRNVAEGDRYERAIVLAQSLLDMRDGVPEQGWNESGQTGGFSWTIRSSPFPTPADSSVTPRLHSVEIRVSWEVGPAPRDFAVETLRPQTRPPAGPQP